MQMLKFELSEAKTIRKLSQSTQSWSTLSPGQIIAQTNLRPIICHGGYAPFSSKKALIWANAGSLTGEFELIDVTVNKQPPALPPVVYTGKLKKAGRHIWGGNNYIADFSDFQKEGLYCVRLKVKDMLQVVDSYVFKIIDSFYLEMARKAAGWFYYQRCGTEVPGWHKACHAEDTLILKSGKRIDASGGWHDAGDYGKWVSSETPGVWALASLADEFKGEVQGNSGVPGPLEEAAWEAKYLCKVYHNGVFHLIFTPVMENVCVWLGAPEKEPPRVVTEAQSLEYSTPPVSSTILTAASLARVARLILPHDKELADRCISITREVQNLATKVDPLNSKYEKEAKTYLSLQAGLLLADLELYCISKDEKYQTDAQQRVQEILSLQDNQGFFYSDYSRATQQIGCGFHLVGLYEFFKQNPTSKLSVKIEDAFKRWVEYVSQFFALSSFGQMGGKAEDGSLRNIGYQSTSNKSLGAFAWSLATAAILLREPKYLEMAERQLQWILGFNPADISMMAGVGRGPGCYHHRYCFMEGHEDGVVPGGVLNRIAGGTGGVVEIGDLRTGNFVVAENFPVDYPIIDTEVWGWTYAWVTNEYWTLNNAWFIMGALQVEKAMRNM